MQSLGDIYKTLFGKRFDIRMGEVAQALIEKNRHLLDYKCKQNFETPLCKVYWNI